MFDAGTDVGPYRIREPVARGRSGAVYCSHDGDGHPVALKMHDDAEAALAEIECLQQVDHPGVISIIEHDNLPSGATWLALPWIDGQTLGHLIDAESPLSLDRTRRIIAQLAGALDAVHHAGFTHGDLAPSNVLIDTAPGATADATTLIDLATSKRIEDGEQTLDRTTGITLETTPRYAAPEVATGRAPEPASDIYALALITYEMLTGASPFPDVATPIAMLGHHASSTPDAPTEHRPDLPGAVEDAILAGLAKDPHDRPATASQFARTLHDDGPGTSAPGERRSSPARLVSFALLILVAAGLFVLGFASIADRPGNDGAERSLAERNELASQLATAPGDAASMVCNLVSNAGFGDAVPDHFYFGDTTNTTTIVEGGGVGGGPALRVGANGTFGIFGEITPIEGDTTFILSAWLRRQGEPDVTTMYVDYLDADFELLTNRRADALVGEVMGSVEGQRALIFSDAPEGAAFAVPTFFKDGSGGSLLVDEIVFGPEETCLNGEGS